MLARKERSLGGTLFRAWITGSLHLTRLTPGLATMNKLCDFNDRGAELAVLLAGSRHPIGQVTACGVLRQR